jgi:hypothetical protein
MWNVEGAHDGDGRPAAQVCQVQGVEYHCFQSSKDPFTLSAWARVKLARLNEPAHAYFWPDRPLRLYAPLEPRAMLARLLGRVAMTAVELREADQFCEPVSRRVRVRRAGVSVPFLLSSANQTRLFDGWLTSPSAPPIQSTAAGLPRLLRAGADADGPGHARLPRQALPLPRPPRVLAGPGAHLQVRATTLIQKETEAVNT